ncbi:MAG: zinc ribbon domain-containing protein [Proteobacteria bacterium]|nr:zinc ribbon domain-containing protein [Pseudomonadota bacterium]MBU1596780.1 zinc ribbon domain-containing protein [Pseudomonadota bacterium]
MPIYEYACGKCGKQFEELVFSAADELEVRCPACGARDSERRVSACAAVVARGRSGGSGPEAASGPAASGGCGSAGPVGGGFR